MKLFSSLVTFSIAESRRPNVILLNTDDFGIGDFQIYNREAKVPTPNIDRIGYEGVKFMDAYSGSSRCSPSRYMLMTGRYDMTDSEYRKVEKGNPHLGEMFAKDFVIIALVHTTNLMLSGYLTYQQVFLF